VLKTAAEEQMTPQERKKAEAQKKAAALMEKMSSSLMPSAEDDDNEPPALKLGDASVAAPFTSKLANVVAIPNIIRQGRCTLVATIQMYKILALNCLISAYSLSVLYLDGIKFSDGQVTISGILMSVCFLSISRAKVSKDILFHNVTTANHCCSLSKHFQRNVLSRTFSTRTLLARSSDSSPSTLSHSSTYLAM